MSIWFKCDARFYKDPKIVGLPDDSARYAFLVIIGEAKYERSGGVFENRQHLEACLPAAYHKSVDALIQAGLLVRRGKKIAIRAWGEWQVDPTSAERARRARSNARTTVEQRSSNGRATVAQRGSNGHATVERREEKSREEKNIIYKQQRNITNGRVESIEQIVRRTSNG